MFPWFLRSKVIHGFGRGGSQLGFPTANLELNEEIITQLLPFKETVLYGWGCIESCESDTEKPSASSSTKLLGPFPFAMSVGTNPHFKNALVSVEPYFVHEFPADFYDSVVRILVLGKIRESLAFSSLDSLIETIKNDVSKTLKVLASQECEMWKGHALITSSDFDALSLPYLKFISDK